MIRSLDASLNSNWVMIMTGNLAYINANINNFIFAKDQNTVYKDSNRLNKWQQWKRYHFQPDFF